MIDQNGNETLMDIAIDTVNIGRQESDKDQTAVLREREASEHSPSPRSSHRKSNRRSKKYKEDRDSVSKSPAKVEDDQASLGSPGSPGSRDKKEKKDKKSRHKSKDERESFLESTEFKLTMQKLDQDGPQGVTV